MASGFINGKEVTFLLDTGATHVAIPEKLASKLQLKGLARGQSSTANGYVDIEFTRINELRLGSIIAYDVTASINPGLNHSDYILLGMSVLKNVEFRQSGNQLELIQY